MLLIAIKVVSFRRARARLINAGEGSDQVRDNVGADKITVHVLKEGSCDGSVDADVLAVAADKILGVDRCSERHDNFAGVRGRGYRYIE